MSIYRFCHYLLATVCLLVIVILSVVSKDIDYFSGIRDLFWSAVGVYAGYWLSVRWNKIQIQKEKEAHSALAKSELIRSLNVNLFILCL